MRTDVKLGVAFSMAIVLIAGGYYFYRDTESQPINLGDRTARSGRSADESAPTRTDEAKKPQDQQRRRGINRSPAPANPRLVRPGTKTATPSGADLADRRVSRTPSNATGPAGMDSSTPPGDRTAQRVQRRTPTDRRSGTGRTPTDQPAQESSLADGGTADRPDKPTPIVPEPQPTTGPARRNAAARRTTPPADQAGDRDSSTNVAVDLHHVQSGDTFAGLAKTYYGSERFTRFLIDSNPQVPDPNTLRVGMRIKIPPAPQDRGISLTARPSPPAAAASDDADGARTGRTYRVQPGDSFYAIARDVLGDATRWQELLAMNNDLVHGDPTRLRPGQIVTLPPK